MTAYIISSRDVYSHERPNVIIPFHLNRFADPHPVHYSTLNSQVLGVNQYFFQFNEYLMHDPYNIFPLILS